MIPFRIAFHLRVVSNVENTVSSSTIGVSYNQSRQNHERQLENNLDKENRFFKYAREMLSLNPTSQLCTVLIPTFLNIVLLQRDWLTFSDELALCMVDNLVIDLDD